MLFNARAHEGSEGPFESHADTPLFGSVRPLGLEKAPAIPPALGMWVLPALNPAIPVEFDAGKTACAQSLAAFMLAAHAAGVVAEGEFDSVEAGAARQFAAHAKRIGDRDEALALHLQIEAHPGFVRVQLRPDPHVSLYTLKDAVNSLESVRAGLGWWLFDVIERVDVQTHYPLKSMRQIGWLASYRGGGAVTDRDYIESAMDYFDGDEDFLGFDLETMTDAQVKELAAEISERLESVHPSELAGWAEGHGWMYGMEEGENPKPPSILSTADAQQALRECGDESACELIRAALQVDALVSETKSFQQAGRDASLQFGESADKFGAYGSEDPDWLERYGQAAIVGWADAIVNLEVVLHHENDVLQGECTDVLMEWLIDTEEPSALAGGVQSVERFLRLHGSVQRLFGYLKEQDA